MTGPRNQAEWEQEHEKSRTVQPGEWGGPIVLPKPRSIQEAAKRGMRAVEELLPELAIKERAAAESWRDRENEEGVARSRSIAVAQELKQLTDTVARAIVEG